MVSEPSWGSSIDAWCRIVPIQSKKQTKDAPVACAEEQQPTIGNHGQPQNPEVCFSDALRGEALEALGFDAGHAPARREQLAAVEEAGCIEGRELGSTHGCMGRGWNQI